MKNPLALKSSLTMDNTELINNLKKMSDPEVLSKTIREMDSSKNIKRIYIMGCGRSGTWLLTSLFCCFADSQVLLKELPIEYFGVLKTNSSNFILKRHDKAYQRVDVIPESITIVWIVRHPFDVLTSHNPMSDRKYHIQPWRFIGEMQALKYLIDNKRSSMLVVKYEDLVNDSIATLNYIAEKLCLTIIAQPNDIINKLNFPPEAVKAMHGVRVINSESIDRSMRYPEHISYIKSIYPRMDIVFKWMETNFGYSIKLPI